MTVSESSVQHQSAVEHLVKMANQIVASIPAPTPEARIASAAVHLKRFWTPAMIAKLKEHAQYGAGDLSPEAAKVVAAL
jgi:hypothetical protein